MLYNTFIALMISPGMPPCEIELYQNPDFLNLAVAMGTDEPGCVSLHRLENGIGLLYNSNIPLATCNINRRINGRIFFGVLYVVGIQGKKLVSLSQEYITKYKEMFWDAEHFSEQETIDAIVNSWFPE